MFTYDSSYNTSQVRLNNFGVDENSIIYEQDDQNDAQQSLDNQKRAPRRRIESGSMVQKLRNEAKQSQIEAMLKSKASKRSNRGLSRILGQGKEPQKDYNPQDDENEGSQADRSNLKMISNNSQNTPGTFDLKCKERETIIEELLRKDAAESLEQNKNKGLSSKR